MVQEGCHGPGVDVAAGHQDSDVLGAALGGQAERTRHRGGGAGLDEQAGVDEDQAQRFGDALSSVVKTPATTSWARS
ncbi:hypothetical protein ACH4Y0_15450 [Streptomyces sp. NPDC020707]|uniref:Uncharacterized protein n=1 Tax=Streptomyces ortus TaxID=2867268 RepID=A0ABT3VCX9_9ACTN|nr:MULTISPECIES: hypothetical protein [Streptomyces]MCX4237792.1 hypothetical protein [Streptomyces ortus]